MTSINPLPDEWSPESWKTKPAAQQPRYPDTARLDAVIGELAKLPPLVTSWEIANLKRQLADAAAGRGFLLQGGDCAENFDDCESPVIANKLKILLQMSLVLVHGGQKQVIRVGRFAGQYAKPRSSDTETRSGVALPSYRGDMINRLGFSTDEREPDPVRLLRGYEKSALTLNFIRSLVDGGFADLHHPEYWKIPFVERSEKAGKYQKIVESIGESLRFFETLAGSKVGHISRVDFFTSHEGLHLLYEQAQTRLIPRVNQWFNLSTHFPWIGDRTRSLDGAHVEYFRGIANPIAVKLGPGTTPEEIRDLLSVLHPHNEPGRLTLIHRLGADRISTDLPPLIRAAQDTGKTVLWCCDPMHGNTESTSGGLKTRDFRKILSELEQAFEIHEEYDSQLGGIHIELTGEKVTECVGGSGGLTEADLSQAYKTQVDPRLNYEQALEIALLVADQMAERRRGS